MIGLHNFFNSIKKYRRDLLIGFVLAIAAGCASWYGSKLLPPYIFEYNMKDVWFESAPTRVSRIMTIRDNEEHSRAEVHPLFSLGAHPPVFILQKVFKMEAHTAIRLTVAFLASIWIFVFFMLLRMVGCRRWDALLFVLLASVSAASLFYFVIPESFSFGSISLLLAFIITVISQERVLPMALYIFNNIFTMSFTITNWMAGILVTFINHPLRKTFRIVVYSFCLVTILWAVQKYIYPEVRFFLGSTKESSFMLQPDSGGPIHVVRSFFYHTMAMPELKIVHRIKSQEWPIMLTQPATPGSGTPWGMAAVVVWTALLAIGFWALFSNQRNKKFRIVLGLTLLGQITLHIVYGDETFLYALHFIALLIPLAALGSLTKLRPLVLALTAILIPLAASNNVIQFNRTLEFFQSHGLGRDRMLMQMFYRPGDPWPRGEGHVVVGYPGTDEYSKAYHEPGGSFSPSAGSFGISLWVMNKNGSLLTTSDSIALNQIRQKFIPTTQPVPGILSVTDYYEAAWLPVRPGAWKLNLTPKKPDIDLMLIIRSVGPAGGAIHTLQKNVDVLTINNRWTLTGDSDLPMVDIGDETQKGWVTADHKTSTLKSDQGWGYAKFKVSGQTPVSVTIEDPLFKTMPPALPNDQIILRISVPDEQFMDSLNAQIAHLTMSRVGLQTRPADPVEYPVTWQREAAYIITALAHAGQIQTAKELSYYLAEKDFFSNLGSEADAPGLAIWTLTEIADRLNDPEYDRQIWPHIQRKAELIEEMLMSDLTVYRTFDGPLTPNLRKRTYLTLTNISSPAKEGLINGKVEDQFQILYVNGISYAGLVRSSLLADRLGYAEQSKRWRDRATGLESAWNKVFSAGQEKNNPHAYGSILWPSGIAKKHQDTFAAYLKDKWRANRDDSGNYKYPQLRTYFLLGEAHQWLYLNQQDQVWKTLKWFWKSQVSPGLYSWWDVANQDTTFEKWNRIRGWVNPKHVTPNYLTAAQMLLLQIDMLAYLDSTEDQPVVIIGGGVPKEWLAHPMSVEGIQLPHRIVDWNWDGRSLTVRIHGAKTEIKLGPAFAPGTPLKIHFDEPTAPNTPIQENS